MFLALLNGGLAISEILELNKVESQIGRLGILFDKISTFLEDSVAIVYGCRGLKSIDFSKNY